MVPPQFTHNFEIDTLDESLLSSCFPMQWKKAYPWDLQQSITNCQGKDLFWKILFGKRFPHSRWGNFSNNLNKSHHPFKKLKIRAIRMTNEIFSLVKNKWINKSSTCKALCSYSNIINTSVIEIGWFCQAKAWCYRYQRDCPSAVGRVGEPWLSYAKQRK